MLFVLGLLKSSVSSAVSLLAKHWKIILPLLVLWYCYAKFNALEARAERSEKQLSAKIVEFDDFKEAIRIKTQFKQTENAIRLSQAKKTLDDSEKRNQALIQKMKLDRERESKNLKELYENRIDSIKHNFTQRVQIESSKAERYRVGMSEVAADTSGLTTSERECYSAYSSLEKACQITTSDYNRLRGWADVACDQVGCE